MSAFIPHPLYRTKKALREAVSANVNIFFEDPSLFGAASIHLHDLQRGQSIICTNHPKRSWFAKVKRLPDGRLTVQ